MNREKDRAAPSDRGLPLVVCLGASKAGTTTLYQYLQQHPLIRCTRQKETGFFAMPERFAQGVPRYLAEQFPGWDGGGLLAEVDNALMTDPAAIERILSVAPEARFIALLRHPVERVWSQYLYRRQYQAIEISFEEALAREPALIDGAAPAEVNRHGFMERSRYGRLLAPVIERVGRERLGIVVSERLAADPQREMDALFAWLGLPSAPIQRRAENPGQAPRNRLLARLAVGRGPVRRLRRLVTWPLERLGLAAGLRRRARRLLFREWKEGEKPVLSPATRRRLLEEFAPDVTAVERWTGLELPDWRR